MKVKEEKTKDLRAKCNNIFYDKDSRKEIEEAITKKAVELKGASEASVNSKDLTEQWSPFLKLFGGLNKTNSPFGPICFFFNRCKQKV